jgi:hypothetical protein
MDSSEVFFFFLKKIELNFPNKWLKTENDEHKNDNQFRFVLEPP